MKKRIVLIITIIVLIILVLVNIILLNKYIDLNKKEETSENKTVENDIEDEQDSSSDDELDKIRLAKLQKMGERERMETYFYSFITLIEEKEYDKAYNLLYPGFKENYFPTIEEFIEYVKKTYPEDAAYNYTDIQRQGTIYILKVEIIDTEATMEQQTKTQRVVIREDDFDNFVLSFQIV